MFWITKYRHNKIVEEYQEAIKDLKASLNRRDDIVKILDRLTDKDTSPFLSVDQGYVTSSDVMDALDDSVITIMQAGGDVKKQKATLFFD